MTTANESCLQARAQIADAAPEVRRVERRSPAVTAAGRRRLERYERGRGIQFGVGEEPVALQLVIDPAVTAVPGRGQQVHANQRHPRRTRKAATARGRER